MSGLSVNLKRGEYREILFWLLLLGSWQFLASPGCKNGIVGAIGLGAARPRDGDITEAQITCPAELVPVAVECLHAPAPRS